MIYSEQDIDTLTRTLYGEARGESRLGQVAVAWVIKNRVNPKRMRRRTVQRVCTEPWQFSCWNENDPNRNKLIALSQTDGEYRRLRQVAEDVLFIVIPDPTSGANHYLNEKFLRRLNALPSWFDVSKMTARIGDHTFLRL